MELRSSLMKKILLLLLVFTLLGSHTLFAQLQNGEKTFIHTQTGKTVGKGKLGIYSNLNFNSKIGDKLSSVTIDNFKSVNYWLVAANAVFTYGFTDHFDASLGLRIYQDTHFENEANIPDDVFVTLRAGNFKFARNHFAQSVLTSFRIPTGEVHNYPFAEYTTNSFQYGLMYAVSYYADPYLPGRAFNAHFNLGFWFYNEHGQLVYERQNGEKLNSTVNSSDFRMALAFAYPTALFDFRLELTGAVFMQRPNSFVYSAEDWAFLTPSVRIKPIKWVSVDLGVDFRISPKDRNNTQGIPDPTTSLDLTPNYPDWKVQMGVNIDLNILSSASAVSDLSYEEQRAREKIETFEKVVEERQKAESVQSEIENLKKVSQEAQKEIEELKKILDDNE